VVFLRDAEATSAEFMSAIDKTLKHADALEERCQLLVEQNIELREAAAQPFPLTYQSISKIDYSPMFDCDVISIELRPIRTFEKVPRHFSREHVIRHFNRLRWNTTRLAMKEVRRLIEEAFNQLSSERLS
jgi:hypothetical protein